eukprot:10968673-Karenia_brevis.AAC.1
MVTRGLKETAKGSPQGIGGGFGTVLMGKPKVAQDILLCCQCYIGSGQRSGNPIFRNGKGLM